VLLLVASGSAFAWAESPDGREGHQPSARASLASTLRYSGTTSEGRDIQLTLERKRRNRLVVVDLDAGFGPWQCGGTGAPQGLDNVGLVVNDVRVRGRFFRAVVPGFVDGTVHTTTGTFNRSLRRVSGTVTHSGTPLDPTNSPCTYSSASVKWFAKR
jgi:hypothetical protein